MNRFLDDFLWFGWRTIESICRGKQSQENILTLAIILPSSSECMQK